MNRGCDACAIFERDWRRGFAARFFNLSNPSHYGLPVPSYDGYPNMSWAEGTSSRRRFLPQTLLRPMLYDEAECNLKCLRSIGRLAGTESVTTRRDRLQFGAAPSGRRNNIRRGALHRCSQACPCRETAKMFVPAHYPFRASTEKFNRSATIRSLSTLVPYWRAPLVTTPTTAGRRSIQGSSVPPRLHRSLR